MNTTASDQFDLRQAIDKNKLRGLWKMMHGYRMPYVLATSALAVSALAKTLVYVLLRYFANTLVNEDPASLPVPGSMLLSFILIGFGFVGLAAFEGGFSFLAGRLSSYSAENITRRLRNYLFDHIQRLSFRYHAKTPTGELIERATSDVDALRRFYSEQAIGLGRIVLIFVINFAAIWILDWQLALLSVVTMPLIIAVSIWFFKRVTKAYEHYQEQEAALSTTLQENLTGVRVVKAFARQGYEQGKFEKDNMEKFKRGRQLLMMHSLFWPLSDIVCGGQMLLGFIVAAWMAIDGRLTIGDYMAYVGWVVWLIWPIRNLGRLIVQASSGQVSYDRVMEIIKQDREDLKTGRSPAGPPLGELVFEQVGFAYEEGQPILQNISFKVQPGQVIALLGSTGSGKTSLANLLPRFYDYTSGRILLDGVELKEYSREYLRRNIGIVEQEPFLFSRSIRENITYGVGRSVSDSEVEEAARAAALHDVILTFPNGYETIVGEKGVTLSGGQKQRTTIARTLLKNPRILILDDSTSAVDTETEVFIREALECLMEDRTTFIIAHRIQSVQSANLIVVLDEGRIIQMGTHAELVEQDGMYRKIYEIQTRIETDLEQEMAVTSQE